jgi:hypothetical protein
MAQGLQQLLGGAQVVAVAELDLGMARASAAMR